MGMSDFYGSSKKTECVRVLHRALKLGINFFDTADIYGSVRNGKPEYVKGACDVSLKRLGKETIDLYYFHRIDPKVPVEETISAMGDLVRTGKVRYLGLSEANDTLRKVHQEHPITALQNEFSVWSREPEARILSICRESNIEFVAYSPLGRVFWRALFRTVTIWIKVIGVLFYLVLKKKL